MITQSRWLLIGIASLAGVWPACGQIADATGGTGREERLVMTPDAGHVAFFPQAAGARSGILDAEAGQLTFQAVLRKSDGNPLPDDQAKLVFRTYRASDGQLLAETPQLTVPMVNGLVHALVPVKTSAFDGQALELGVSVNGEPELSPRIPLTTAPYAFRVNRVASDELDDDVVLGTDGVSSGSLTVLHDDGSDAIIADTITSNARLILDRGDHEAALVVNSSGAQLSFLDDNRDRVVLSSLDGDGPGSSPGGTLSLYNGGSQSLRTVRISGDAADNGSAGELEMYNASGETSLLLQGSESGIDGRGEGRHQQADKPDSADAVGPRDGAPHDH